MDLSPHSPLWHYLWIGPHLFQALVAATMIRRGLARQFPAFLSYLVFDFVQNVALFAADHVSAVSSEAYWKLHWIGFSITMALRFAVIYEVLARVLHPYPGLEEFGRVLLRWSGVILLLVGAAVAAYAPPTGNPPIVAGVQVLDSVVSLMQGGMLIALFLFSGYFGLSWRSFVFGIALGLGILAAVHLAAAAIGMSATSNAFTPILDTVRMAAYHCSVLVWLFYLLAPVAASQTVQVLPDHNLRRWNTELERLLMR